MSQPESVTPTPAKQAQEKALGHAAALKELASEFPAGSRTHEDEAVLRTWAQEGHELREDAAELRPKREVHVEGKSWALTTPEKQREMVAAGEIKPSSGPND